MVKIEVAKEMAAPRPSKEAPTRLKLLLFGEPGNVAPEFRVSLIVLIRGLGAPYSRNLRRTGRLCVEHFLIV